MKRKSFFGCGETPVSSVHAEGTSLPPPKVMKTDSKLFVTVENVILTFKFIGVVNSLSALYHLESLFPPSEAFACHPPLPVIVLKHQIYSLLEDRTTVDRELVS